MIEEQMLWARVLRIEYDFIAFAGKLYMEAGDCCDMTGCIDFFKKIDPNVIYIATISGKDADTSYRLINDEWGAFPAALKGKSPPPDGK